MPDAIECCLQNADPATRERLRRIDREAGGVRTALSPCLQRCGDCRLGPFLVVDGELGRGRHGALLDGLAVGGDASGEPDGSGPELPEAER